MQRSLVVIAHNIRSLWNVGAIFRSADAFRTEHIHLTGYTAAPPNKEIGKTALGAEDFVSWSKDADPAEVIRTRRAEGFSIVSLESGEGSISLPDFRPPEKICLILGHEILGVSEELRRMSDVTVHIPMLGQKESLNVSVATGIALYHCRTSSTFSLSQAIKSEK